LHAPNVLVVGIDPRALPGMDADAIEAALEQGQAEFEKRGIRADLCLVGLDGTVEAKIVRYLTRTSYACVVVGGGIRKPEPMLPFFEKVVNLIRQHAPRAAIAFNTSPMDSADAAMRWIATP
jgi:hypothetical protein